MKTQSSVRFIVAYMDVDNVLHVCEAVDKFPIPAGATVSHMRVIDTEAGENNTSPDTGLGTDVLNIKIEDLEINVRTFNALFREGISRVRDIVGLNRMDLLRLRHFGHASLKDLCAGMERYGIVYRPNPSDRMHRGAWVGVPDASK